MLNYSARNREFVWVTIWRFRGGFDEGLEDCILEERVTDQGNVLNRFGKYIQ